MKRRVKSYLVFTSSAYRAVVYLLVPAALVVLSLWAQSRLRSAALLAPALFLIMTEVVFDNWLFGGIQARHFEKMDYLKTSQRGMGVLRDALCMDLLRKFLASLGILAVCDAAVVLVDGSSRLSFLYGSSDLGGVGAEAEILLYYGLVSYFFSALGTYLSRYGSLLWFNMVIGYFFMMTPALLCLVLLPGMLHYIFLCNLLFAVLSVCVSFIAVRAAMKKVEGSFYDK